MLILFLIADVDPVAGGDFEQGASRVCAACVRPSDSRPIMCASCFQCMCAHVYEPFAVHV